MRGRYGIFEPATFVCAAVLLWPFFYGNILEIGWAVTFQPQSPLVTTSAVVIMLGASLALPLVEALIAYLIAFFVCDFVHRVFMPLNIRRIHLPTAVLLTLVAGASVGIFVTNEHALLTRDGVYYGYIVAKIWAYIPPTLVALFIICIASEMYLVKSIPAALPLAEEPSYPFSNWWARQLANPSAPTLRERLFYAVPLLLFIAMVVLAPILLEELRFKVYRLDLPIFCKPVVYWAGSGHARLCAALVVLLGIYVGWISQSRKRMLIFALILLLALLISSVLLLFTLILPLLPHDYPCVVEGEGVDTSDGSRPIEALQVGDAILCCDASGQRVAGRVDAVRVNSAAHYLKLELDGAITLRVTAAHPLATPSGYRPAGELRSGDAVLTRDGVRLIQSIHTIQKIVRVYDLSVSPHPNFYAAGVLVHNKMRKK